MLYLINLLNHKGRPYSKEEFYLSSLDEDLQRYYLNKCKYDELYGMFTCYCLGSIGVYESPIFSSAKKEMINFLINFEPGEKEIIARFQADDSTAITDKNVQERLLEIAGTWLQLFEEIGKEEYNKYRMKNNYVNSKLEDHVREKGLTIDYAAPGPPVKIYGSISNEEFNQHMKEYDWDFDERFVVLFCDLFY
jgi:hypothetical protein